MKANHQAGDRARHTAQGADDACHSRGAQLGLVDNVVGIVHKPGIPEYGAEEIEQQHSYGYHGELSISGRHRLCLLRTAGSLCQTPVLIHIGIE